MTNGREELPDTGNTTPWRSRTSAYIERGIYILNILSCGFFCEYVCPASVRLPRSKPLPPSGFDVWHRLGVTVRSLPIDLIRSPPGRSSVVAVIASGPSLFPTLSYIPCPLRYRLFLSYVRICFTGLRFHRGRRRFHRASGPDFLSRSSVGPLHGSSISIGRRFMATDGRRRRR